MIKRTISSTGEQLPVIGLGTWKVFDKTEHQDTEGLTDVLSSMKKSGATLIDSSPMYGKAEEKIGSLTINSSLHDHFFYATKVWTTGRQQGIQQMNESFKRMNRSTMDLMQIHNLTDWKTHLETLNEWKAAGKIRYTGITHYTDDMHQELERILLTETIDFVQFNYSVFSRNAEKSLLKVAANQGVATLINRPFGEGRFFSKVKNIKLPQWANEHNIKTWSQFFLWYIIAEPSVTVIIPATGNPLHAKENFDVMNMELPDEPIRKKMRDFIDSL